jgi:hypothetical protein
MRSVRNLTLGLVLLVPWLAGAAALTTPQIVATTLAGLPACVHWRPVGTCLWLRCTWSGCSIRTSLKVGH